MLTRVNAACSRTDDTSYQRIAYSSGRSESVPTVPSTTTAFRGSPRNFARFIGDFRNAALNAA